VCHIHPGTKHIKDNTNREIAKEILSMMLKRKKKNFSHIKMFVVDFEIAYKGDNVI